MNNSTHDAGIPVLTEIIPAAGNGSPPPAPMARPNHVPQETQTSPAQDGEQWTELERDIRERVLQQVLERIDFVLEQRVRDSLADVLQTAVESLTADIRSGLHHTIRDVVARAVSQEISKLQSSKK
ncbi:hypothetical protein D3870_04505 [Noviherbaspirillum cavernae]|uniref:DUF2486 family protein n=1 Tax=Noviherbaspirillum cavernae TaxID=2320862 RepID=A0A418WYP8_9BURK|nr:hypothetical protein [Noviherbaspirillum cavernae]RJG05379.1 hypothetical protein D3870_04505 [Noviherbaspirillum cavernae]